MRRQIGEEWVVALDAEDEVAWLRAYLPPKPQGRKGKGQAEGESLLAYKIELVPQGLSTTTQLPAHPRQTRGETSLRHCGGCNMRVLSRRTRRWRSSQTASS